MLAIFWARHMHHVLVVGRVVADVAGDVSPSRCRRCGAPAPACPASPTAAPAVRRAGRAGTVESPLEPYVRPGRVIGSRSSAASPGRESATARRRWPGSRRTAGTPASCSRRPGARPRRPSLKQSAGEHGATMAAGHSPLRPNIACSRSACSVLVGRPVLGPPRCTSMMTQRQFGHHGQADGLRLEADAGAAGGGHADARRRTTRRWPCRSRRSRPRPGCSERR